MTQILESEVTIRGTDAYPPRNLEVLDDLVKKFGLSSIEELHYFPKQISIEPTSSCNARCFMCPVEEWERTHVLMPDPIFEKVLADIQPFVHWIERISLPIIGEPLIDKRLESKIRRLKQIGAKVVDLTSNASLMSERRAISLIEAGLDAIDYSMDGARRDTFEAIRKRLKFDECVENIEKFIAVRDRLNPNLRIRVRMTVSELNVNELVEFKDFWSKRLGKQDQVYGKLLHNWGNWDASPILETPLDNATLDTMPCISPWIVFNIFTDGRVPLCCVDFNAEERLGNVMESSIADIWRSPTNRMLREGHGQLGRNSHKKCIGCYAWEQTLKV